MKKFLWLPIIVVLGTGAALAEPSQRASVVELFTSQGCSSCPPADRLLGELAERDDVVALAFHINYWDKLGWPDPFATEWGTDRQYHYSRVLGRGYAYTPQMVIDGVHDVIGSERRTVESILTKSRVHRDRRVPVRLTWHRMNRHLTIDLPASDARRKPAKVFLVRYDGRHDTDVARGENGGRQLADFNVVREMRQLGDWTGDAVQFEAMVSAPGRAGGGVAVLVQEPGQGRILGAAKLAFGPAS
jgi:hypothetical protein